MRGIKIRLIDADNIRMSHVRMKNFEPYIMLEDLIKVIDSQPTIYDVDKVVEQLEDKVKEYDERIEKRKGPTFFDETERIKQFDERAWGIEIAIEIVKGGGVNVDITNKEEMV